jgi:hypothetical protein
MVPAIEATSAVHVPGRVLAIASATIRMFQAKCSLIAAPIEAISTSSSRHIRLKPPWSLGVFCA